IGGVTLQIVRDWVVKFNAHGPDGLIDRKPPGQPSRLTEAHRTALMTRIDDGPIPSVHGVVRWRLVDLIAWLWEEFRVTISKQTLSREVRALGYRPLLIGHKFGQQLGVLAAAMSGRSLSETRPSDSL